MVILNLIVFVKEQMDVIVNNILKNKFALQVVEGGAVASFRLTPSGIKNTPGGLCYSVCFKKPGIGENRRKRKQRFSRYRFFHFCESRFHLDAPFYDNIMNEVIGVSLSDKEKEEVIFTKQHAT